MTKICSKCKQEKELTEFYKDKRSTDGLYCHCKECHHKMTSNWKKHNSQRVNLKSREWYQNNLEYKRKQNREWAKNNPDRCRDKYYKWRFDISLMDYNNLFIQQKERCAICSRHQSEFTKRLAVDHNHKTGEIRGLLCKDCNRAIGLLRDNFNNCIKAAQYLRSKK